MVTWHVVTNLEKKSHDDMAWECMTNVQRRAGLAVSHGPSIFGQDHRPADQVLYTRTPIPIHK